MIKRKKVDTRPEKSILTGMIVSTEFLSGFQYLYKPELFQISFIKIVAGWCWDYYKTYEKAPGTVIQSIFEEKSEGLNEEISKAIEGMLLNLSEELDRQDKFNHKYILDTAQTYLQGRNLELLTANVDTLVRNGELHEAEALLSGFKQVKKPEGNGISLFSDFDKLKDVLSDSEGDVLFALKGPAGEIIEPLCREELIGILAPQKRGKTWAMQEIMKQGILRGFNVAWFNFEMPEKQLLTRFISNFTGKPTKPTYEGCLIPIFDCEYNQCGTCRKAKRQGINDVVLTDNQGNIPEFDDAPKGYKPCSMCKDSKDKEVRAKYKMAVWYKKSIKKAVHANGSAIARLKAIKPYIRGANLKIIRWPGRTKSIKDVKNQLDIWENQEGFIPDIVVTDYADIMLPVDKNIKDYRHKIDSIWLEHKQLAQEKNCLVVTASQANTFDKRLTKDSQSEDRRKSGHVDKFIGLNQTPEEKVKGIIRWSVLFERNGEQSPFDIVVLQQLKIGNAYLDSYIDESYGEKLK